MASSREIAMLKVWLVELAGTVTEWAPAVKSVPVAAVPAIVVMENVGGAVVAESKVNVGDRFEPSRTL